MLQLWRQTVACLVLLTLITGIIYPLAVTGVAQLAFPRQANGSLLMRDGKAIGSSLIGQLFSSPGYFWGRLSATSPTPCNAANSSGSNLGPLNPALLDSVKTRIAQLQAADPAAQTVAPVDLVTASASGLDPDISPAAAACQIARVARARNLEESKVRELVSKHIHPRQLGVLGEPRVNVLELNLALNALSR